MERVEKGKRTEREGHFWNQLGENKKKRNIEYIQGKRVFFFNQKSYHPSPISSFPL